VRIAYLDCSTGISGDMTLAALIDAGIDPAAIRRGIDSMGLEGVELVTETVIKGGFRAVHVRVEHPEQHAHRHLSDVHALIDRADAVTPAQKDLAKRIFGAVAKAEAKVHGMSIEEVHFHEVGAIDSIVDIVGAAIGFDLLGADQIISSPLPPGRGQVRIDHGICTVPTPGTAELLKGIPLVDIPVEAELTTPTGAAIVATLVDRFGYLPEMTIDRIGYGAGTKNFPSRANVLRLFVGTALVSAETDQIILLETNLDDVPGEVVGYTRQKLFDAGALDVYTIPIQMKKDRPGVILSILCSPHAAEAMETILFQETGTFGIRRQIIERSKLARKEHTALTVWGPVRGKIGWRHGEEPIFTPEFEDCAKLAREHSVPLRQIYRTAEAAFDSQRFTPQAPSPTDHHDHHGHSHDHSHDHSQDHDHSHDHDHHE
jgi:pyridinium-3,5-bisthiocarboxylic acid mononucleotide nickel chelatase